MIRANFVTLSLIAVACNRPPQAAPSDSADASAPAGSSARSPEVPPARSSASARSPERPTSWDLATFISEGCPPGQHDVRKWKRIDAAKVTDDQRYKLNHSQCSWAVSVREGTVVAEAHEYKQRPAVPQGFVFPERWGPPRVVQRGRSGVLLGFNHGEWGGALLWYSDDGKSKGELLEENIVELLPVPNGFTVFAGLSHLDSDTGRVTELVDTGTVYRLGRSVDLGSAPCAVAVESGGTVLVATMAGLVRLRPEFRIDKLLSTRWSMLHPVSVALDAQTAYVGMRGVVVEIQLGPGGATETWLSPIDLP